jgi:hypothetical protein
MIVCSVQPYYRYSGLSTDEKPRVEILDASTFWETDTGKEFEWRKNDWYLKTLQPIIAIVTFPTSLNDLAQVAYEDGDILYVCKAATGSLVNSPVWQVKKVDGFFIQWADGNNNFDNLATDLITVKNLDFS